MGKIKSLEELRADGAAIYKELTLLRSGQTALPLKRIEHRIKAASDRFAQMAEATVIRLGNLAQRKGRELQYFRSLQVDNKAYRPARSPDPLDTILLAVIFMLFEGGITAAMLVSEGRMEVVPGVAYGLAFALVNVMLGLTTGFLPLRYLAYRHHAEEPRHSDQAIRNLAKAGLAIAVAAQLLLIFAAARLRALGTHEGVFDFSTVGLLATFDDGISIIIVIIGSLSAILATWKGYSGLSDPIPGFSEAWQSGTADMDDVAEDLAEDQIEVIEDLSDHVSDACEPVLQEAAALPKAYGEQLADLACRIVAHNDAVRDAMAQQEQRAAARTRGRDYIRGQQVDREQLDLSAYHALLIPALDQSFEVKSIANQDGQQPLLELIDELHAASDRASADIRAALAAYHADAPAIEFLLDEGESDVTTRI